MEVIVEKYTDEELMRRACSMTINGAESKMTLKKIYECEHSPMRTQMFWVEMRGIPTFVSTHFRTHNTGITHFVKSNREDRSGFTGDQGRWQPVNHAMWLNAQNIINLARKRLCRKSHEETVKVMQEIVAAVCKVDPDLGNILRPECLYRNGCHELSSCGYFAKMKALK